MRKYTAPSGITYDVSDAFGSIELHVPGLTDDERHRVIGNIATLANIDAQLGGQDPGDLIPGATIDQLHGGALSPDTCGCKLHYFWLHGSDLAERMHVPHESPTETRHCAHHAHHKGNAKAHHEAVLAENRHKNAALAEAATALGVSTSDIAWEHDDERRLVLKHADIHKARAALARLGPTTVLG